MLLVMEVDLSRAEAWLWRNHPEYVAERDRDGGRFPYLAKIGG